MSEVRRESWEALVAAHAEAAAKDRQGFTIVMEGATTLAPLAERIRAMHPEPADAGAACLTARYGIVRAPVLQTLVEGFVADLERKATGRDPVGELRTSRGAGCTDGGTMSASGRGRSFPIRTTRLRSLRSRRR